MVFHPIKKLNHPRTSHPPRRAIFPASGKVSATSEPSPSCQPHIPALFVQKRRGAADYCARARFGTCCTAGATISGAAMIRALLFVPLLLPLTACAPTQARDGPSPAQRATGEESSRERGCQVVQIWVVPVTLKKK